MTGFGRGHDCARTNSHAWHDSCVVADPHVMADDRVSDRQVLVAKCLGLEDPKWIGCETSHGMIGRTGYEIAAPSNLHKFANHQPLATFVTEIGCQYLGRFSRCSRMREIAEDADLNTRMVNDVLQVNRVRIDPAVR